MKRRNVFAALFAPLVPIASAQPAIVQNIVIGSAVSRSDLVEAMRAASEQSKADILKSLQRRGGIG